MSSRGRLTIDQDRHRAEVEQPLFDAGKLINQVDEIMLRVRQAQQRSPLVVEVLAPAELRLAEVRRNLAGLQAEMAEVWAGHNGRSWK